MRAYIGRTLLKMMGWEVNSVIPPGTKKCVIAVAPHTSWWDFVIGRLAYWKMGIKPKFLIKKEAFRFPVRRLLLNMGGVPVDRGRSSKMVDQIVELFNKSESLIIVITPEGTRKAVKHWKKGFYHIAYKANVPIGLGFIDYGNKKGGVGKVIMPNGDIDGQMEEMMEFYKTMKAKHPEHFRLHER
jgi:1-acyl-sn-glycerol-3-phosphate acyltransferase